MNKFYKGTLTLYASLGSTLQSECPFVGAEGAPQSECPFGEGGRFFWGVFYCKGASSCPSAAS